MFDFVGKTVHFIGVGGISCNALAKFVLDFGGKMSGSDRKLTSICDVLQERGASLWQGEKPENINADIVVFSSAIAKDNKELKYAREKGLPIFERHEFLGEVSRLFSMSVAIGGTHGKTSTTAMLTHVLKDNSFPFVSMIGGECVDYSNYVNNIGAKGVAELKRHAFVCEACEYKRHFLSIKRDVGVITNIECDHPDCYNDIYSVKTAFEEFAKGCNFVIEQKKFNADESGNFNIKCKDRILSMHIFGDGATVSENGKNIGRFCLCDDGEYNYRNALYAIAAAKLLGVDYSSSLKSLESYKGVKRRFERCEEVDGAPLIFDFAHHPSEIECAIKRAEKYGNILLVFQPHTYSRTKAYLDDFALVLAKCPCVKTLAIMPVYPARETLSMGVDSDAIVKAIFDKFHKRDVYLLENAQSTVDFVKRHANQHDVVLMLGAGDIYDLKRELSH